MSGHRPWSEIRGPNRATAPTPSTPMDRAAELAAQLPDDLDVDTIDDLTPEQMVVLVDLVQAVKAVHDGEQGTE